MKRVAIVAAKRTALGAFQGQFASVPAPQLASFPIKACLEQAGLKGEQIDEAFMGNVLSAGVGQAPARQAVLAAGLPKSVITSTVNKVCGSGMKTMMMGADAINAGSADIVIAGGMESMSNAPYLLPKARTGYRMGNQQVVDGMVHDGLWDPYGNVHMGNGGELCAEKYGFTREDQDEFALESLKRASVAIETGAFNEEITPVTVESRKGSKTFSVDEQPGLARPDKIPALRPAFKKDGTVTAANASSINDGAAVVILASEEKVKELGLTPLAWITGQATYAHEPDYFTTAPVYAMQKLLKNIKLKASDIDLWEVNEAFAVVTMAATKELKLDPETVNVNGGATALGHPIGCSGTRVLVTLLYAMKQQDKKRGIASLCIGGGEGIALSIELP
ncbi:MAG: acetyl-CoA C-acetyltransferase [bacterium]|jgi:acetyl-CoA C-acetyltransferase